MTARFDITRPEVLADPYSLFATLRREAPVAQIAPHGHYVVSRYDDVMFVLRNIGLFSNSGYNAAMPAELPQDLPPSIVQSDPPRHTRLRGIVSKAFTPKVVAQLEGRIREISEELVNAAAKKESFELVNEITIPLPMIVISELLGIPAGRRHEFKRWSDKMLSTLSLHKVSIQEVLQVQMEVFQFFSELVEQRTAKPERDLISLLIGAEVDGERLSTFDLVAFLNTLLIAGNETTTSLIGNTLVALTDNPETYAELRSNPALIPETIEEVLRFEPPAQCIYRQATQDVALGGVTIPKGAVVLPLLASANRDESKFPNAGRFDIHRDKSHIAFGFGAHFCIGAPLARLEAKVVLEVMMSKLGALKRRDAQVQWAPSFFTRTPQELTLVRA